jgi:hypothetical protein
LKEKVCRTNLNTEEKLKENMQKKSETPPERTSSGKFQPI